MRKVTVDPARLHLDAKTALRCPYRLKEVVDARPAGNSSGHMGTSAFEIADPVGIVRDELRTLGLTEAAQGPDVSVRLMQLYFATNRVTKVPVVVYEATLAGHAPMIVRGQPASINWWGSDSEATSALGVALREANRRLVSNLNSACPAPASTPVSTAAADS